MNAIIATVDQNPAPLRHATGSDAYAALHKAMIARLAELEAQKHVAVSTDRS
ncbi:hypothetical protein J6500_05290 [Bradyrhizobium sp. WSM 1704]|uniref:hypothetical protein n=1 Tax=Bradyrhizobium semiaridum TaxID=2821404 RepID=UPI001CE23937|nr:hypothetical protein [Bradyrhizobium semiaridum]MCA6121319.1 hypothetical protein [Bradyrhizobium semiaridum]